MSQPAFPYHADNHRYDVQPYRRVGRSGLQLPAISLGLWHNFGDNTPLQTQREVLHAAFDLGINHFDLANNYGVPYGSAEANFGRLFQQDFRGYRDELIISTKAGWDMWPGPHGQGGSSRKYLLASLDQSLQRLGLDYVDIFYSHRFDADTPLAETAWALASSVQQGKALYVGISSYDGPQTLEIARLLNEWKIPLLIHQPVYNIFHRALEGGMLDAIEQVGAGTIVFSPLAQGLLTNKYLSGIPDESRIGRGSRYLVSNDISEQKLARVRALNDIAQARGQSLAQLALAWVLRDARVTSALIGASTAAQVRENVAALANLKFTQEELTAIDAIAGF